MKIGFYIGLFCCCLPVWATAQFDAGKLNELLQSYHDNQKVMMGICLSQNGNPVYTRNVGYADVEHKIESDSNTRYHIGSISKMFTAVLIYQLVEEGKLHMDTCLSQFFPEVTNSQRIHISHLLQHRSGLVNFTNDSSYLHYMELPHTRRQLLDRFAQSPSAFEPDTKAAYSNTNYILLSMIIEKICDSSYDEVLQQRICKPLGLRNTRVATIINTQDHEAQSYDFRSDRWVTSTQTHMSVPLGAGAIESTPQDLCRFIEQLFAGKLIQDSTLQRMITIRDHYGSGILQFPYNERKAYGHNGGIDGFQGMLIYLPETSLAMAITGNAWNYPMNSVAIAAMNIYFGLPFIQPSFQKHTIEYTDPHRPEGSYRNDKVDKVMKISKQGETLMAQALGQAAFPLQQKENQTYVFEAANIEIVFQQDKEGNYTGFQLKQGQMDVWFEREK